MSRGCPYTKAKDIDFMDPLVQENWFEAYDVLRDESPVYYMPQLGSHVLTRYEDIEYVLRRPTLFTAGPDLNDTEPLLKFAEARELYEQKGWRRYTPLGENLPKHKHYRALVDPKLSATQIKRREPFVRATINELIDSWIDDGEIEFMKQFAEPLPMIVIAEFLGFPRMDLPQLKQWSAAWVLPFSRGLTLEQELEAVEKHIELQHYIYDTMQDKRKNPKNDIISHLLSAEVEDVETGKQRKLTDTEVIGITDHLLIGGNETTAFAIANGLWLLFRYPQVEQQLRSEPGRIKNFVEETLRIESPTQGLFRFVSEDTELAGVSLAKGATLSIRYGAGNHDPARFPKPDLPELERKNAGRHLAFGLGEHVCPGATLSRLEQNWAWEILLQRLASISPMPEKDNYEHIKGMWMRALCQIHLRFNPA
ncbi:MAG: cytochrome P450 [Pseudomonadales bacterium]